MLYGDVKCGRYSLGDHRYLLRYCQLVVCIITNVAKDNLVSFKMFPW